jgi:hypothetical protein
MSAASGNAIKREPSTRDRRMPSAKSSAEIESAFQAGAGTPRLLR